MSAASVSRKDAHSLHLISDSGPVDGSSEMPEGSRPATSADTVKRILAGDIDAFEPIYRAHSGLIFGLCLRMSGDAVLAQELTQSVFVRAWERLHSFRGDAAFGSWLHRIAVNVVLEQLRSDRRRSARVVIESDATSDLETAVAKSADERLDIDDAISRLPRGARVAFVLYAIEGYSYEEMSMLTGLAMGTLRAQVFRARQLLISILS